MFNRLFKQGIDGNQNVIDNFFIVNSTCSIIVNIKERINK